MQTSPQDGLVTAQATNSRSARLLSILTGCFLTLCRAACTCGRTRRTRAGAAARVAARRARATPSGFLQLAAAAASGSMTACRRSRLHRAPRRTSGDGRTPCQRRQGLTGRDWCCPLPPPVGNLDQSQLKAEVLSSEDTTDIQEGMVSGTAPLPSGSGRGCRTCAGRGRFLPQHRRRHC